MTENYYNEVTRELKDKKIVEALKKAVTLFEDGAIIEARDVLINVVYALDEFD